MWHGHGVTFRACVRRGPAAAGDGPTGYLSLVNIRPQSSRPASVMLLLLLLLLLLLPLALTRTPAPTRDCSYFGYLTAAGACTCNAPWQGARCNELSAAPPAARSRAAAGRDYAALLRGSGIFVAVCDPSDPMERADCTVGLNVALQHNGTVFVPRLHDEHQQPVPWRVRGFTFRADNARVVFEHGVEVQALKNSTYLYACLKTADLATANHQRNLSIIGWGASWRMWRDDYVAKCQHSEFRMGFQISNCSDTEVVGLTIHDSGGDGIILMSSQFVCTNYSRPGNPKDPVHCTKGTYQNYGANRNVLIDSVILDRNYRQGLSGACFMSHTSLCTSFRAASFLSIDRSALPHYSDLGSKPAGHQHDLLEHEWNAPRLGGRPRAGPFHWTKCGA